MIDIKFKRGVDPQGCTVENIRAMVICAGVFADHGHILTVTSMFDGKHSKTSLHYRGGVNNAFDIRSRDEVEDGGLQWLRDKKRIIARECSKKLGDDYDFIIEGNHFHCEYDPD